MRPVLIVTAAAAALLLGAWSPGPKAIATAEAGKVWHDVSADPKGAAALARGVVDIDAPPSVVWRLMMDCAATQRIMPSNRGCKVLKTGDGWDVREHMLKTPLQMVRSVFRSDVTPERKMVFHRVDGDMKIMEGEWRLQPLDGGKRTRVTHEMRMQPGFSAPGFMVRSFVRGEVSEGLANLRAESEAAAKS